MRPTSPVSAVTDSWKTFDGSMAARSVLACGWPAPAAESQDGGEAAAAAAAGDGDGDDDDAPKPKLDGNGGSTDTYRWVQTLEDLTVSVPVPEGACAGPAA